MKIYSVKVYFLSILFLFSTCQKDFEYHISYEGTTGQPSDINLSSFVPQVPFHLDINPGDGFFILDTGSPFNIVDYGKYNSEIGVQYIDSSGLGLVFYDLRWLCDDIFDDNFNISGLIGGDILINFNWILDYESETFTLYPKNEDFSIEDDEFSIKFDRKGGGIYQLSSGEKVQVSKTRHILNINVEGVDVHALLDTGASYVVLTQSLYDTLDNSDRPQYGNTTVTTVSGSINAPLTELRTIKFADAPFASEKNNIKIVVIPDSFLAPLSSEVGQDIKILLGGSFLSYFKLKVNENKNIIYIKPINFSKKSSYNLKHSVSIYKPVFRH